MLLSEHQERTRRFALALRASIPVLMLIGLIAYVIILKNNFQLNSIENSFLMIATIFASVYFVYFLIELETKESLLDPLSKSYNEPTFNKKLLSYKPQAMGIFKIEDMQTLQDAFGMDWASETIYKTTQQIENELQGNGEKKPLIGRNYSGEWIVATSQIEEDKLIGILKKIIQDSNHIGYSFATVTTKNSDYKNAISHLRDLLLSSYDNQKGDVTHDIDELNKIEEESIIAVKEHNISFTFRPLRNVSLGAIDIYEVFVRLKTYENEELAPKQYLPIINRLGLTRQYDLSIVNHILDLATKVKDNISFSFNLSPFSLRDDIFKEHFFSLLKSSNVDPSRLIIQLYERKTHHNLNSYLQTLQSLRDRGVKICIDNFGSSNSSIDYMKHFRFDMVQFDRDYVVYIDDEHRQTLLKSMIKMSNQLQITTIAKWVDEEDQLTKLKALGVNYLQGFAIGKHVTQDELLYKHQVQ